MPRRHLIIGCGTAALAALARLRRLNQEDEVKLVSRESHVPYSPTALAYLLAGRMTQSSLPLRDSTFFSLMGAQLELGREVTRVEPQAKEVHYHDGGQESYDTLLIATGSHPLKPPIPGLDGAGLPFHTLKDCLRLQAHLEGKRKVAVLGSGLVGMEVAWALKERGLSVTVIEKEPRVLPLYFDVQSSTLIEAVFNSEGVALRTGAEVVGVQKGGGRFRLLFRDGESMEVEALVVAVGVAPSFMDVPGIATRRGILVDQSMATNQEGIFAAGDVAESPDFFTGEPGVNATLVTAAAQGKVAGARMVGEEAEYPGWVPANLFNFFGHMALSLGTSQPQTGDAEVWEEAKGSTFKRLAFSQDRLIGACLIDHPNVRPGALQYIIEHRIDLFSHKQDLWEWPGEVALALVKQEERRATRSLEG